MNDKNIPRLTIGIPVYNGEKFLHKKLKSVLSQTFTDFQIIISDNASTDSTEKICKEYESSDKRIKYVRQKNNIGSRENFFFVLQQAKTEYFVWTAVDDLISERFLEECIKKLDSNSNIIGCITQNDYYGIQTKNSRTKMVQLYSLTGTFDKKARFFFKKNLSNMLYSVFRTEILKKCFVVDPISSWDSGTILNLIKNGDIFVLDKILLFFFLEGISSTGILNRIKNEPELQKFKFPNSLFVYWCMKKFGKKFILKNFDIFIWHNFVIFISIISEYFKNKNLFCNR